MQPIVPDPNTGSTENVQRSTRQADRLKDGKCNVNLDFCHIGDAKQPAPAGVVPPKRKHALIVGLHDPDVTTLNECTRRSPSSEHVGQGGPNFELDRARLF